MQEEKSAVAAAAAEQKRIRKALLDAELELQRASLVARSATEKAKVCQLGKNLCRLPRLGRLDTVDHAARTPQHFSFSDLPILPLIAPIPQTHHLLSPFTCVKDRMLIPIRLPIVLHQRHPSWCSPVFPHPVMSLFSKSCACGFICLIPPSTTMLLAESSWQLKEEEASQDVKESQNLLSSKLEEAEKLRRKLAASETSVAELQAALADLRSSSGESVAQLRSSLEASLSELRASSAAETTRLMLEASGLAAAKQMLDAEVERLRAEASIAREEAGRASSELQRVKRERDDALWAAERQVGGRPNLKGIRDPSLRMVFLNLLFLHLHRSDSHPLLLMPFTSPYWLPRIFCELMFHFLMAADMHGVGRLDPPDFSPLRHSFPCVIPASI